MSLETDNKSNMRPSPRSKKAAHLVMCALGDLDESKACKGGVSAKKLAEFISSEYELPARYQRHITTALERGVAFGAIGKTRGKYFLGDVLEGVRQHRRRRRSRSHSKSRRRRRRGGSRRRRRRHHVQ